MSGRRRVPRKGPPPLCREGRYRRLADRSVRWTATEAMETAISVYGTRAVMKGDLILPGQGSTQRCWMSTKWGSIRRGDSMWRRRRSTKIIGSDEQRLFNVDAKVSTSLMETSRLAWSWLWTLSTRSLKQPWCEGEASDPFWIGVSRSTDHLCRRRIPRVVSESSNRLEDRGWPSRCESHSLGEVDPWSAKPFSFGEGDATDANSIRSLKVEILWKNPISCSGNPFEEGAPLQRILFVMKGEGPWCECQSLAEGNPPKEGKPLTGDNHSPWGEAPIATPFAEERGTAEAKGIHLMKQEEVHQIWRTLPTSEADSHRGLGPHVAEPNLGSCWWRGPCWC